MQLFRVGKGSDAALCNGLHSMIIRFLFIFILSTLITQAASWPTVKGSISRDGRSSEKLRLPLHNAWMHTSAHAPAPAWPAPANINSATGQLLENSMTYDRCYHPVIANGKLYYGSSADDTVYCINAHTGDLIWKFVTGAPIRIAPVISGKNLLAGSDDGNLYSLNADTGQLQWKYRGGPDTSIRTKMFIGNGRMISRWPIRCGIVADGGALYFTSGLFPVEGVFLHALNISDGSEIWKTSIDVSAQGHMLASSDALFITTGRNTPVNSFSRNTGKKIDHFGKTSSWGKNLTGGSNAILIDDQLISGPSEGVQANVYNIKAPSTTLTTVDAIGVIADPTSIYSATPLLAREEVFQLKSLNRVINLKNSEIQRAVGKLNSEAKKINAERDSKSKDLEKKKSATENQEQVKQLEAEIAEIDARLKVIPDEIKAVTALERDALQWKVKVKRPCSLLLDAASLYAGFDGFICAYSLSDGSEIWRQELKGKVYSMAVCDGALFASTDEGVLYCLRSDISENPGTCQPDRFVQENIVLPEVLQSALKENGFSGRPGFCLIVDAVDGSLALAAAASTGCRVILVSPDPGVTGKIRARLAQAGVYGSRVVVHELTTDALPYPPGFADLIMSEAAFINGKLPSSPGQLHNYVRPDGGILALALPSGTSTPKALRDWGGQYFKGWNVVATTDWDVAIFRRAALEGAGEWTHEYAEPGGTSNSGDNLVNADMDLQWFGEPGPGGMVDRHFRNVPPLYKNGRLFVPGNNRLYGVNAYNGSVLWEREIPDSRRTGAFLDAGSMAVDENRLYIASAGECQALDVETGRQVKTYHIPTGKTDDPLQWGLVGHTGNILLGSTCVKGSSHSILTKEANQFLWKLGMQVVTSVNIFALDKKTASEKWIYSGGKVLNTSIVFNDKNIYFLEVSGSAAATNALGRMKISELFADGIQELVALSVETGKEIFRRKIDTLSFTEPVYLQTVKGTLLLSGSKPEDQALRYSYYSYNAETGSENWHKSHLTFNKKANDGHGQQNRHPVIIDNTVYAWPYAYRLDTGEKIEGWTMDRRGHGCGGVSASGSSLFWRGGNPWMISPDTGESAKRLTYITRPGCWINIIPAGGADHDTRGQLRLHLRLFHSDLTDIWPTGKSISNFLPQIPHSRTQALAHFSTSQPVLNGAFGKPQVRQCILKILICNCHWQNKPSITHT